MLKSLETLNYMFKRTSVHHWFATQKQVLSKCNISEWQQQWKVMPEIFSKIFESPRDLYSVKNAMEVLPGVLFTLR